MVTGNTQVERNADNEFVFVHTFAQKFGKTEYPKKLRFATIEGRRGLTYWDDGRWNKWLGVEDVAFPPDARAARRMFDEHFEINDIVFTWNK